MIDKELLEEYWQYWKKIHKQARNHPLAKPNTKDKTKGYPFGCSINEFTNIPSRVQQNNLKQREFEHFQILVVFWLQNCYF